LPSRRECMILHSFFDFWTEFASGIMSITILGGIASAAGYQVLVFLLKYLSKLIRTSRGALTGTWTAYSFEESGQVRKHDFYNVEQRGDKLYISGTRDFPRDQKGQQWYFRGIVRHSIVTGYFYSKEEKNRSVGCLMLWVDRESEICSGFYTTRHESRITPEGSFTSEIRQNPYLWVRGERKFEEGAKYHGQG
jgi:hypothetical protein